MQNKVIVLASFVDAGTDLKRLELDLYKLFIFAYSQKKEGNDVEIHWITNSNHLKELISTCIEQQKIDITISITKVQPTENSVEEATDDNWFEEDVSDEVKSYIELSHSAALEIVPPTALDELPIWFFGITSWGSGDIPS